MRTCDEENQAGERDVDQRVELAPQQQHEIAVEELAPPEKNGLLLGELHGFGTKGCEGDRRETIIVQIHAVPSRLQ